MRTIREFEERVHAVFAGGGLPGAVHLYAGQEAVAVGVCAELADDDYVASTHRGHGHAIAKGCDVSGMMLEIYGKAGGLCGGKGGSMHIADFGRGMLGANGVAAGGVPLTCGAALSAKVRGTTQVAVAFVGDGGANQGSFAESLSLAAVWQLPCVFVVEDNGYAQATGTRFHLGGRNVAPRAEAVGIPAAVVDGYDFFEVRAAAEEAVHRARAGGGPSLLECKARRFFGHMEGWDHQAYRPAGEVDTLRTEHDCIQLFIDRVLSERSMSAEELAETDREVRRLIDTAVDRARAAPDPDVAELLTNVYVNY
ncbi:MAG: thiamine pyrophosphate-dependent dehydrogenase E1 component subunit alpha [Kutzneria sp.]|nr:thiamine pyrophosphate-dependent dehydrogenase E1 component subunit alpha [Kutzneria sp.]